MLPHELIVLDYSHHKNEISNVIFHQLFLDKESITLICNPNEMTKEKFHRYDSFESTNVDAHRK